MNQKDIADMEQALTLVSETMPLMWHRMYKNSKEAGFNDVQAFRLLQTYILAQCPYGVRGDDG